MQDEQRHRDQRDRVADVGEVCPAQKILKGRLWRRRVPGGRANCATDRGPPARSIVHCAHFLIPEAQRSANGIRSHLSYGRKICTVARPFVGRCAWTTLASTVRSDRTIATLRETRGDGAMMDLETFQALRTDDGQHLLAEIDGARPDRGEHARPRHRVAPSLPRAARRRRDDAGAPPRAGTHKIRR